MAIINANITLDPRWERVPGVSVFDNGVEIDTEQYFFRYEKPLWKVVDWAKVQAKWDELDETSDTSLEQKCLDFIHEHSKPTTDPSEVLENAEKMYDFLYDEKRLDLSGLPYVTGTHLKALKEASTMMALNRVDRDGKARNVGPAWFFPVCTQKVFDLSDEESVEVDELYHGGFFTESRRIDGVKAHCALGGRLVHGCQGAPNMAGGCILEYGSSIEGFHDDLISFRDEWIKAIKDWK